MYDIFFLSYGEDQAKIGFAELQKRFPHAKHVSGIRGIDKAHQYCATLSLTNHFFVVDADNNVENDEVFHYRVPEWDAGYVHLWYARNPVNNLAYGWGGLKLFPKNAWGDKSLMPLDMTTTFPLKIIPEIVSTTHFNTSPYATWRSAFRETVKLTQLAPSRETRNRLYGWCNVAQGAYAAHCLSGSREGARYGETNRDNLDALLLINDYDWLSARFAERAAALS